MFGLDRPQAARILAMSYEDMKVLAVGAVASCSWLASAASAEVQLSIQNGRVSLVAKDATVRQILTEWARVGQTKIVNVERIPGGPLTLELNNVPEQEALDILLRSISGYMAAPQRDRPPQTSPGSTASSSCRPPRRRASRHGRGAAAGVRAAAIPAAAVSAATAGADDDADDERPPECAARRIRAARCSTRSRSRSCEPADRIPHGQASRRSRSAADAPSVSSVRPRRPAASQSRGWSRRRRSSLASSRTTGLPGQPVRRPGGPTAPIGQSSLPSSTISTPPSPTRCASSDPSGLARFACSRRRS